MALIGVMLSDVLPEGVHFGDEWFNPRPDDATVAMCKRGWQPPPRYPSVPGPSRTQKG